MGRGWFKPRAAPIAARSLAEVVMLMIAAGPPGALLIRPKTTTVMISSVIAPTNRRRTRYVATPFLASLCAYGHYGRDAALHRDAARPARAASRGESGQPTAASLALGIGDIPIGYVVDRDIVVHRRGVDVAGHHVETLRIEQEHQGQFFGHQLLHLIVNGATLSGLDGPATLHHQRIERRIAVGREVEDRK